ncbi:hypothetical protein C5167_021781 [Papaver somniferum]|uniref:Cleavage stimulation factor 50 kDa subunit n=1 Tax=Papaver somniferum TaxID=3469 RepID=A0A4Y7JG09_PAPSO|nr:hypothetical protein C5167_021781 [Papaver somniferum]
METSLEQILQDGKLLRQVNDLIVAHLRDNNLNQAAIAVASATMTPLNVESPPNKLIELVAKGLAVERDEAFRGVAPAAALFDYGSAAIPAGYGLVPPPRITSVDFSAVQDTKGASKSFPKHETRHVSEHKVRYSSTGGTYVTASKDGAVRIWDGVTAQCVRSMVGAHGSAEATSASFTKDQR